MVEALDVKGKRSVNKLIRPIIPLLLIVLALSGSLSTLIPRVYNPYGRSLQEAVFESMIWLKGSPCVSGVASSGLWSDYQYLPALTGITYPGDFVKPPEVVLQKSTQLKFNCVVVAVRSEYFGLFHVSSKFESEYQNQTLEGFMIHAIRA